MKAAKIAINEGVLYSNSGPTQSSVFLSSLHRHFTFIDDSKTDINDCGYTMKSRSKKLIQELKDFFLVRLTSVMKKRQKSSEVL